MMASRERNVRWVLSLAIGGLCVGLFLRPKVGNDVEARSTGSASVSKDQPTSPAVVPSFTSNTATPRQLTAEVSPNAPTEFPDDGGPGVRPAPRYHPRHEREWQGRLVEISVKEPCNDMGFCGRARACRADHTCGPCLQDSDCEAQERCVLDNCILATNVRCTRRDDCGGESLCMLSDNGAYGVRGNEGLVAVCSESEEERALAVRAQDQEPEGLPDKEHVADPVDRREIRSSLQSFVNRPLRRMASATGSINSEVEAR